MTPRLNPYKAAPETMKMLAAVENFSETELANLTLCVAAINAWNRLAISFLAVHPVHLEGRGLKTRPRCADC